MAQLRGECGVQLEPGYSRASFDQGTGQYAGPCANVDNERAGGDSGDANELRCESATAEEVLAGSAPCGSLPNGHGRSPSSSSQGF